MLRGAWLWLALVSAGDPSAAAVPGEPWAGAVEVAARIDEQLEQHWRSAGARPANPADDATFLRRLTLDLVGRIPTRREAQAFVADASADKRFAAVRRLLASPEFPLHFSNVLDEMIQGRYAGDGEFLAYLRESLGAHKAWDQLFRELLVGPWDTPEHKRAERFLSRRLRNLDELTNDTSRVFFGVDISCAKCHDHPLVDDWKQDHFYGLSSFFNRTYEFKGKEQTLVGEKDTGDIEYVSRGGEQRKAKLVFLTGAVIAEPPPVDDAQKKAAAEQAKKDGRYLPPEFSRRDQLVRAALDERRMFSRAVVNKTWAYLLGRGLVQPVDQMHSANAAAVPGLLEYLADDLAERGYHLERLVAAICTSRVYALDSAWTYGPQRPAAEQFAAAPLRALSPKQYAVSFLLAAADETFDAVTDPAVRAEQHRQFDERAGGLTEWLDARSDNFQSSAGEALFMSNHPGVQQLLKPEGNNLTARLSGLGDRSQAAALAVWTVLSRPPAGDEPSVFGGWLDKQPNYALACRDLVWAMVTSAEFRFNH